MGNVKSRRFGIAMKWFLGTFVVILTVLSALVVLVVFAVRNSYYSTVESVLKSYMRTQPVRTILASRNDDARFNEAAASFTENFSSADMTEVWVIDRYGSVVASTSGFIVRGENMPDYNAALTSGSLGKWTGRNSGGEKIMAITSMLPYTGDTSGGAIRYMVSMEAIDSQINRIALMLVFLLFAVMLLVAVSGIFFIRSIVIPVRKINESAQKLASGDYRTEIDLRHGNDELGDLVDAFNSMARAVGAADRMKNDFISTVSHELRTPLTAIKGWAETIRSSGGDREVVQRGMEVINDESERLEVMVEDLLDFSRMESGRMQLRLSDIDGIAELDECILAMSDRAKKEGVTLITEESELPAPIRGDAVRVRQVFMNIIDNAFKYTESGGSLTVTAKVGGDSLTVSFADTGVGIPENYLPHVKEKFFKANMSAGGAGIGLAVCDEICRLHGGKLDIQSVYGSGTTVTVTLPLKKQN
ncbi:MAG: HAMP domain-containing histidine kinase [Clostridia bacterium]|nr:HAMP domain-containing histidine kinase [Clostridia bacterium]